MQTDGVVVSLDDTSVTEWRFPVGSSLSGNNKFHSMIPVLLNGGTTTPTSPTAPPTVSLDDTSVTEWRFQITQ